VVEKETFVSVWLNFISQISTIFQLLSEDATAQGDLPDGKRETRDLEASIPSLLLGEAPRNRRNLVVASCALFFIVLAVVLLGTLLTVITKVMTVPMANYTAALILQTTFAYVPLTLIYMLFKWKAGKLAYADLIYPWRPVTAVACLYAVGQILLIYGTQYTSGPMQVILSQSAIPFSMGISHMMLGSTYRCRHYVGAVLVLLGILLAVGGSLAQEKVGRFEAGWIVGYVLSWIPYVIYTVYGESLYRSRARPPDPVIFTGIISAVQFLFLCLLAPTLPYLKRPPAPVSSLPASLIAGGKCLVGINTLPTDDCWPLAPILVLSYNVLNVILLYPTFALLEHGSSNLFWLACTLIVPFSGFAFSLPFIPGAEPVTVEEGLSLLVIVFGLGIYGWSKESAVRGVEALKQAAPKRTSKKPLVGVGVENAEVSVEMAPLDATGSSFSTSLSSSSAPSSPLPACLLEARADDKEEDRERHSCDVVGWKRKIAGVTEAAEEDGKASRPPRAVLLAVEEERARRRQ